MRLVDLYREMLHVTDEALVDELVRISEFRALKAGEQLIGQGMQFLSEKQTRAPRP